MESILCQDFRGTTFEFAVYNDTKASMADTMDTANGSPRGVKRKADDPRLATSAPKRIKVEGWTSTD